MKFRDILNEGGWEDYNKLSRKVKLLYRAIRIGSVNISKLIPIFHLPFWTGFDWIEDDVTITYELPTEYYLIPGGLVGTNKIVIRSITINCEKYPALADDVDIRQDLLRYISRRIKKYLSVTLDDGEDIELSIRKKHEESDRFKNTINESVSNDHKENEYSHLVKKVPTIYKALKKGTLELTIHSWDFNTVKPPQYEEQIKFNYDLSNLYKIKIDEFNNNYPVIIYTPEIKIDCPDEPELNTQSIKRRILEKVRKKFQHFGLTIYTRPSEFFLKSNGTWTNL
jgi:hypothetical protein